MSRSIDVVIAPGPYSTRVLATEHPRRTLLRAHRSPTATHPRALPFLLEALAFWEGATVRGVLAADGWGATSATPLYRDVFADAGTPPLYSLDGVCLARRPRSGPAAPAAPRHRDDFGDLRQLLRRGGSR